MMHNYDRLVLQAVSKSYQQGDKDIAVLKNLSCDFQQGSSYAITGVSGSGKSTLLHLLGGLDEPSTGAVLYNDHNLASMQRAHKTIFLNRHIGFVFQFHYLVKELRVLENIMMPGLIRGERQRDCVQRAQQLLGLVGLTEKASSYPTHLSGGQQQRVALARALFNKPSFLLADEPTGNLDADNAQRVVDIILQAQQEWNMGIVMCSHDEAIFDRMHTVYRLHDGQLAI